MGCLGCGCLVLALLAILFVGLVGGTLYLGYRTALHLTTTTPPAIPSFEGSDDLYQSTRQKIVDFDHDVKNHQAATIRFTADEINILIARNPDVISSHLHAFVTLSDNEARLQASLPTDALSDGILKGRYFSLDTSFEVHFDQTSKSVNVIPHTLAFGGKVFMGPNSGDDRAAQSFMRSFTPAFNQTFNSGIRKNPDGAALLDQAKSIEIEDSQLVIETQ
jgi:hypothetical protein